MLLFSAQVEDLSATGPLRLSPRYVSLGLVTLGALLVVLAHQTSFSQTQNINLLVLSLLCDAAAVLNWLLTDWQPRLARAFCLLFALGLLFLSAIWIGTPAFLSFAVFPVLLAMALCGIAAALTTTLVETILWLALYNAGLLAIEAVSLLCGLAALWATWGLLVAIEQPLRQALEWSWHEFQRAQTLLEAARDRKAELAQTLEDLAYANRQQALLNEKLQALRAVAEEAQNAKAAFVANVSHELRTPLNIITSLVDLLMETPEVYGEALPATLLDDLQIVHRNCEHLSHLVTDVLDLSQAEAGQLALRREWVNLTDLLGSALEVVRPLAEKKELNLRFSLPPTLSRVYCDPRRIRQVLLNLVSNAVRFTDCGAITVRATQQVNHVIISVADTGAGIGQEQARRIFEPFYRDGSQSARASEGYGLGLSISRQLVEAQGGRMWVESTLGSGSIFFFTVPSTPPEAPLVRPGRWLHEEWIWHEDRLRRGTPGSPLQERVVLCDRRGELYSHFAHCADTIEIVKTRELAEAITAAQACPAHAVIVNDSSVEQAAAMAEQARLVLADTPIVACAFQSPLQRAHEAGAVAYLLKPVLSGELKNVIHQLNRPVPRVLVVEDNPDIQLILQRMLLSYSGVTEVIIAASGRQALEELRRHGAPSLMLLDIVLPDMDGWQVLQLKNQDITLREIPVIILSAQDPADQPLTSPHLLATIGQGFSISKLLYGSLLLSALMLRPVPTPGQSPG